MRPIDLLFEELVVSMVKHGDNENYNVEAEMLSEELTEVARLTGFTPQDIVCDGWLAQWLTVPNRRGYAYCSIVRARPCEVVSAARVVALER